jgi:hypothetical protein
MSLDGRRPSRHHPKRVRSRSTPVRAEPHLGSIHHLTRIRPYDQEPRRGAEGAGAKSSPRQGQHDESCSLDCWIRIAASIFAVLQEHRTLEVASQSQGPQTGGEAAAH